MTQPRRTVWRQLLLALVSFVVLTTPAFAQGNQEIATLEAFRGGVEVVRLGQSQTPSASMPLLRDDIVVTRQGRATVRFHSDGTVLRIGPDSRVQINESATDRDVTVFLGRLWAHVVRWQDRSTRFRSGSTIAAVRGTEVTLAVATDGDQTEVSVVEGRVEASTDAGKLELTGGQSTIGRKGVAPTLGLRVRPQDAVQWAIYYVPVIYVQPSQLGQGSWQDSMRQANEAYLKGDLQRAIEILRGVQGAPDARFFTYRASLLLATGSVPEARADIDQALKLAPNDSTALSLQTIIAVVNNDADGAVGLGQKAVSADPKSATAQIALSYARQAQFDIEGARASLETAVSLDPDDALAWARLAEIRSSQGYLDEALEAAQRAVKLEPNLSRTQTVLGYAFLTRVQTAEARKAFERAIELDRDDPLPRLGQGLAKIRDGELDEGNRDLEIAVSLDPAQAVVRSYLGKGYFEAKRVGGLDEREYQVAKEADPNDPTPWLYDAIAKQTTNRPVEALGSLQRAIELNDNRAVYRSRLLLDSDLAARSASLGRIYSDLGFQNLALVEGWSSVNTDPSNHSAHRFLADSYAALPRHEIARVSELFQSQMLQPLNTTPIQPRLGESNLFLISAGGPSSLSFNEFNPLFNRNAINAQGTLLTGHDNLWSGEGILAGIYDKVSFSVGYNQFETDGWREGAFQDDNIANVFFQAELSPETSIQTEYRYRDRENGDLQQRFFEEAFLPDNLDAKEQHTFRVGGRQTFAPGSILLGSVMFQDAESRILTAAGPDFSIDTATAQSAYGVESQYLFRKRYVDVTAGFGFFNIEGDTQTTVAIGPFVDESLDQSAYDHLDLYAYANAKPLTNVTVTVGGSFDRLTGDLPGEEGNHFNPKVGVTWNPVPGTTVRAAAFRAVKRTLITDQTLEPTQVAGFNQFFDDFNLTQAWRYGGAVDQKLGSGMFAGGEFSKRDLTVPFIDLDTTVQEAPWDEYLFRAYLFATPHRYVGIRAQYVFERFERDERLTFGYRKIDTHRLPVGFGLFHPSGIGASVTTTYWNQEGNFEQLFEPGFKTGQSDFWLTDLAVNSRLPQRYGFVTLGITNLFNKKFEYFEIDLDNPTITPARAVVARLTIAFP